MMWGSKTFAQSHRHPSPCHEGVKLHRLDLESNSKGRASFSLIQISVLYYNIPDHLRLSLIKDKSNQDKTLITKNITCPQIRSLFSLGERKEISK